jgi:murein L,D-transpeptidase YcbB/YkuD
MSIIRKGLAHAGPGYFARNNMYFVTSGGQVKKYATPAERMSGKVAIVQRGGSSNSLGRIIFRFDNRFSVYLHHTNAPWAFQAGKRAISHGCIRLQRPLDLARFVLSDSNQDKYDKIEYSFQCDLSSKDSTMFIKKVDLEPQIPVYLLYNTLFRAPGSNVVSEYADVYGLDRKLYYKLMRIVDPIDSARNANKEKSRQSGSTASPERKKPSADSNRVSSPSSEHPSNNATVKREDDNKPTV